MTVDVIIPVYNASAYVARAVRSALACPSAQVLLVDDGSTDGSSEICNALARDSRVRVVHQENRGAAAARNTGLDAATAPCVAFLDADDTLVPGALDVLLAHMGNADAIQGRIVRRNEAVAHVQTCQLDGRAALERALENPTRHLLCHGWVFRRALLTERFSTALTLGEDGEWLMRTLLHARQAAFCTAAAYRYTVRADSTLHGSCRDVVARYRCTLAAAETALGRVQVPHAEAMYQLTHLLLMLTHGVFRQKGLVRSCREASALCREFRQAFENARLTGHSPRIWTLRFLKWRLIPMAYLAVRIRQAMNDRVAKANGTYEVNDR